MHVRQREHGAACRAAGQVRADHKVERERAHGAGAVAVVLADEEVGLVLAALAAVHLVLDARQVAQLRLVRVLLQNDLVVARAICAASERRDQRATLKAGVP